MPRTSLTLLAFMMVATASLLMQPAAAAQPQIIRQGSTLRYLDPRITSEPSVSVHGRLTTATVDRSDGTGSTTSLIITDDNRFLSVSLDTDAVPNGSVVTADLTRPIANPARVIALRATPATSPAATTQRAYVAIVTNGGADATDTVNARVDAGLHWWSTEAGRANTSFKRAATKTFASKSADTCGFDDYAPLWQEAARQFTGVSFNASGNHLAVVSPGSCSYHGTVGIATVGTGISSGGAVTVSDRPNIFTATLAHELGHNYGLDHAGVADCTGCEYLNAYSVMGLAINGSEPTSLDSVYRGQLHLTSSGEIANVAAGTSATVTLAPRGADTGLRGVEVPQRGITYWLDWRSGSGRDASSYYPREAGGTRIIYDIAYPFGVTVTSQATGSKDKTLLRAWVDRVDDEDIQQGAWAAGQTFTAPGVKVAVQSITDVGATVVVTNAGHPVGSATPRISGTTRVGSRVSVALGKWSSGTTFTARWQLSNGSALTSSTKTSVTLPASSAGHSISVCVTGTAIGYLPATRCATAVKVGYGILSGATPKISGTLKAGRTLSVARGAWTSGASLTQQWYAAGKAIRGATGTRYTIAKSLTGKSLSVKVTGRKTGYTTLTKGSRSTGKVG